MDNLIEKITFNEDGLIPVIAQNADNNEVLMLAWMNEEAFKKTLETGQMYYYSRSRKSLWRKGESSNQTQELVEIRLDCDGDSLLALVRQKGVACHTGRHSCFFFTAKKKQWGINQNVVTPPEELYK